MTFILQKDKIFMNIYTAQIVSLGNVKLKVNIYIHFNFVEFFVAGCWQINIGQKNSRVLEVYLD